MDNIIDPSKYPRFSDEEFVGFTPNVQSFHHIAYKCRNAEETRHFYEDVLGLEFITAIQEEIADPKTGKATEFLHIFFALPNGECIAFFDIGDGQGPATDPQTPAFVQHIAFAVPDKKSLFAMKERLAAAGIPVDYVRDHDFVWSIYFSDPNGYRLELACPGIIELRDKKASAAENLRKWMSRERVTS